LSQERVLEGSFRVFRRASQVLMGSPKGWFRAWCRGVCTSQGIDRCGSLAFPCTGLSPCQLSLRRQLPPSRSHRAPSPPSRRHTGSLAARATPTRRPWLQQAPLLEFLKDRPSTDVPVCVLSRLPEVRVCHTRTRSALVVLPDFGGFLRTRLAGLLHPATGHGVRLVSSRSADIRRTDDPPPRRPCPSELFAGAAGVPFPGSLPPRRWSTPTEADAFPDLEDLLRTRVPPARHCCRRAELPWVSLDPGFHRGTPLPEAPLVSQCPVHVPYIGFSSPQRPLHVGARRLPAPPLRMEP
jgi:hypothetical protein